MNDTCRFLATDLKMLFEKGEITEARYSPDITFEDPITKYTNREGYSKCHLLDAGPVETMVL
mgnify:CR=1 FL=1